MSRSYQKVAGWTSYGPWRQYSKRLSNKKIRKTWDLPNGKAYRKILDSWEICDYRMLEHSIRKETPPDTIPYIPLTGFSSNWNPTEKETLHWWYRAWMKK